MRKICPPEYELLSPNQHKIVSRVLDICDQVKFSRSELMNPVVVKEILNLMASVFQTDYDFERLLNLVSQLVNCNHLSGLWFAYFLQLLAHRLQKSWFLQIQAKLAYSDAQINFNHDLAFNSTEIAYNSFLIAKAQLEAMSLNQIQKLALKQIEEDIKQRLKVFHNFYSDWGKPIDPMKFNPLTDNLYYYRTRRFLPKAFPKLNLNDEKRIEVDLLSVIKTCKGQDLKYYRVIARHILGHWYISSGKPNLATQQLELAFEEAKELDLKGEINHISRLLGYGYECSGNLVEAIRYFLYAYKNDYPEIASYWRALTGLELGSAFRKAAMLGIEIPGFSPSKNELMQKSLKYYREGRHRFEAPLIDSSELPISSAIKLQMFRCYSENAIDQAYNMNSTQDLLEEIEFNSPRQIVQLVSEIQAAQDFDAASTSKTELQKIRAVFHQHLGTVPESFDDYLEEFTEQYRARYTYLQRRIHLLRKTANSQRSDLVVDEILKLRIPKTSFLLFNIGRFSFYAFLDMEKGTVKTDRILFSEKELQAIQQEYVQAIKKGESDDEKIQQAINSLLSRYEILLNPIFEPLLSEIENKHLKIFPRLQMNMVPLHALKINDKRLIDYCDVSYNQNLSLFLALHKEEKDSLTDPPLVVFNEEETYGHLRGAINTIEREYKDKTEVLVDSSWQDFKTATTQTGIKDIFLACHGRYNPNNPTLSYLTIGEDKEVGFPKIFSSLDLSNYRSIVLAACESGLVKTEMAAEYLGLPSAFMASGVRYVIGSLWEVHEFTTAIIFSKYFELLSTGQYSQTKALNEAQRQLKNMQKEQAIDWTKKNLPSLSSKLIPKIKKLQDNPFTHPIYWAPFYISGDT